MKKTASLPVMFLLVFAACAQAPEGYYEPAFSKSRYELKEALFGIISEHKTLKYAELWDAYLQTDADADSNILDMYNDCDFKFKEDQCGTGSSGNLQDQCKCYNREHSMPKSWFHDDKEKTPMYTDLFHLYPVSGYVNSRRNNNPFGEVEKPAYTSTAGSKLGPCSFPGYTGTAFEPLDKYKGDMARTYFYMATCYHDRVDTWTSDMLDSNNLDVFTRWSKELLLKWHRLDPVSEKEIRRNEVVYGIQGNRNPFIDHPELAEKIWGDDTGPWNGTDTMPVPPDTTGLQDHLPNHCKISVSGRFLQVDRETGTMEAVEIFDISGKRICATFVRQSRFGYTLPCAGIYIVRVSIDKRRRFSLKVAVL